MIKRFETSNLRAPLSEQFSTGFEAISLWRGPNHLYAVALCREDGSCLKIESKTWDVSENDWLELGVLTFSEVPLSIASDAVERESVVRFDLPQTLRGPLRACKLVIVADAGDVKGVESESGLILRSALGKEIVIVSNAMPFDVTVLADFIPDAFTPEYDLAQYKRVPL